MTNTKNELIGTTMHLEINEHNGVLKLRPTPHEEDPFLFGTEHCNEKSVRLYNTKFKCRWHEGEVWECKVIDFRILDNTDATGRRMIAVYVDAQRLVRDTNIRFDKLLGAMITEEVSGTHVISSESEKATFKDVDYVARDGRIVTVREVRLEDGTLVNRSPTNNVRQRKQVYTRKRLKELGDDERARITDLTALLPPALPEGLAESRV